MRHNVLFAMTASLTASLVGCATPPASDQSALVPFDMSTGRPVVEVTLKDGSKAPFIFDTGAMGGSVSQALAARLDLPVTGRARLGSPHGGDLFEANIVDMGALSLGSVAAKVTTATSSAQLDAFAPGGAGNVLGPRQFSDKVVEFDFAASQLWLGPRPRVTPRVWFKMDARGFLSGTAQLAGRDVPFTIDVGNPGGVITSLSLARRLMPGGDFADTGLRMGPIGAQQPLFLAQLAMPIRFGGLRAQIDRVGALDGAPDYLNLGAQTLRGLTLVLDNPNQRWGLVGTPAGPLSMALPPRRGADGMQPAASVSP